MKEIREQLENLLMRTTTYPILREEEESNLLPHFPFTFSENEKLGMAQAELNNWPTDGYLLRIVQFGVGGIHMLVYANDESLDEELQLLNVMATSDEDVTQGLKFLHKTVGQWRK